MREKKRQKWYEEIDQKAKYLFFLFILSNLKANKRNFRRLNRSIGSSDSVFNL